MNLDRGLAIRGGRKYLRFAGRNRGVALNDFSKHLSQGLNPQRQRRNI